MALRGGCDDPIVWRRPQYKAKIGDKYVIAAVASNGGMSKPAGVKINHANIHNVTEMNAIVAIVKLADGSPEEFFIQSFIVNNY